MAKKRAPVKKKRKPAAAKKEPLVKATQKKAPASSMMSTATQFYSVAENGSLRKVNKIDFRDNKVFLINDIKTMYLWFGQKASKKKQDLSVKKANILNQKRKKPAKIQIIRQNKEFGSFLAMMDSLKNGLNEKKTIERRPELKIKIKSTLELIEAGLDPDLEAEITIAAHELMQQKKSYEELCRILAEIQLSILKGKKKHIEKDINNIIDEIQRSSSTYDELCWLIVELSLLKDKKSFK